MADAYGTVVVGFSDDFQGDLGAICAELNELNLQDGGFVVSGKTISPTHYPIQYPTLRPQREQTLKVAVDGMENQFIRVNEDDLTADMNVYDDEISAPEIAKILARHISVGAMSISCCSNERGRYLDSQSIQVNADGSGQKFTISGGNSEIAYHEVENF